MAHHAIVAELLAHRGWMRAIARELTRDDAAAEDLVQDAYVAALRSPPRTTDAVRAWMRTVLRRRGAALRTSDAARSRREQALPAARELPSPAEAAARAETQQRVVRAVMALDEPYRGTLLLRFFEDAGPTEIAERMGVPVETVRTRVRRGLALVRARLTAEDDEPGAWRAALLPWSDLAPPAPNAGPEPGVLAGIAGGVAVGLGWKIAAGAALVLAGWWMWGGAGGAPAGPDTAAAASPVRIAGEAARRERARGPASAADAHAATGEVADPAAAPAPSAPAPVRRVAGTVRVGGRVGGRAVEGALVTVRRRGADDPRVDVRSDAEGRYAVTLADLGGRAPPDLRVTVDAADLVPLDVVHALPATAPDGVETLDLALEPAVHVTGRLVDPAGAPLAGHPVALVELRDRASRVADETRSGAGGEFTLRAAANSTRQLVGVSPERPPAQRTVRIVERPVRTPDLVVEDGHEVVVRVRTGAAVRSEDVVVVADPLSPQGNDVRVGGVALSVDDGELRRGAHPFERRDGAWHARGYARGETVYARAFPRGAVYDLKRRARLGDEHGAFDDGIYRVVSAPAEITLHVRAVRTRLHVLEGDRPARAGTRISIWMGVGTDVARTDGDGIATAWLTPGQTYKLRASGATWGVDPVRATIPADADEHDVWLQLPDPERLATIRFTFEGEETPPRLLGVVVQRFDAEGDRPVGSGTVRPDADGTYELAGLPVGRHRVIARIDQGPWGASGYWLPHEADVELVGGETVTLPTALRRGGRLRLRSLDGTGTPVRTEITLRTADGADVPFHTIQVVDEGLALTNRSCVGENGVEVVPVLPPGTYRVTFTSKGGEPVEREVVVEAGRTSVVTTEVAPAE